MSGEPKESVVTAWKRARRRAALDEAADPVG
jgi:hypothetical protein